MCNYFWVNPSILVLFLCKIFSIFKKYIFYDKLDNTLICIFINATLMAMCFYKQIIANHSENKYIIFSNMCVNVYAKTKKQIINDRGK